MPRAAGGGRGISQTDYDKMVESFREHPGDMSKAMNASGCGLHTCEKAWRGGWPEKGWPPISVFLAEESKKARQFVESTEKHKQAMLANPSDVAMQRADDAAIAMEQRVMEGKMAQLAIKNSAAGLAIISGILKASAGLSNTLFKNISEGKDENGATIPVEDRVKMLRQVMMMSKTVIEAAKHAQEIERLRLGLPTAIVGLGLATDMTAEQAIAQVEEASRILARAKEFGMLDDVIDVEPIPGTEKPGT